MKKLQPENVVDMLKKEGTEVSLEQAAKILEFLRMASSIVVARHLEERKVNRERELAPNK